MCANPGTRIESKQHQWQFTSARMMAAVALVAMSLLGLPLRGLVFSIPPQIGIPFIGACWGAAVGVVRDGWVGVVPGAILGAAGLTFSVFLIMQLLTQP